MPKGKTVLNNGIKIKAEEKLKIYCVMFYVAASIHNTLKLFV